MAPILGTRLGVYEVTAQIGQGGMGQVYRATDTKLKRQVAIKILPPLLAGDADRLARFQREAEVLASLSHPHIAAIYGLEERDGVFALVMELVEGEGLDRRIRRGPIPVDESLVIAGQIAEALEAAHEKGIVHRDLKPANIMLTHEGSVKVLDFGLAKRSDVGMPALDAANSPTITSPAMMTDFGVILGTAAYMSPEQARGKPVDKRADIWAFGCILFEMLTGRAAFHADTVSDVIAAILTREPDWNLVLPSVRPGIHRVLRKCLEKDPRQRLRDIGDARMEIDEVMAAPASADPDPRAPAGPVRVMWPVILVTAILLVAVGAALQYWRARPVMPAPVRLSLPVPGLFFTEPPEAELSPDGRQVAFVSADSSGKDMLWIRALDSTEARVLPGTERANLAFWSPDSRVVGFFADSQLKTVEASGGSVHVVTSATVSTGATWNQDGTILFAQFGGPRRVSAAGGVASLVGTAAGSLLVWPHFLPDGRHFLYLGNSAKQGRGVYVGSLDTSDSKRLFTSEFEARYAAPGYLLFIRDETLLAQPFDARRLEFTGEPAVVATGAWAARGYGHGVFSAGSNGALAYVNADITNTQLAWFDRNGRPLGTIGPPGRYESPPQLSPDGQRIAVARGPYFRHDLWVLDATHETETRFTFGPAESRVPVWSPDGSRILFQSGSGDGRPRMYWKSASGAGVEERLADVSLINLQDLSPDGRFAVYMISKDGHFQLWGLPLSGDRRPFPFLQTDFNNGQAQISPDGHWIAYVSNETGRDEVYVQSFPTAGSKHQVSSQGGAQPRWRKNGGELFYLAPDRSLMAVPVNGGAGLQVGRPTALFPTRLEFLGLQGPAFMPGYAVSADGQRFLLNAPPERAVVPINIFLNWTAVLNRNE